MTLNTHPRAVSHSIRIHCAPEIVFAQWADVSRWHEWDPDTTSASLSGPFALGATGKIKSGKGMAVPMTVTELTPDRSFTVVVSLLGSHMAFPHTLVQEGGDCIVTHRVEIHGWLAPLLMATVGKQVDRGLPITLARLKARCEQVK